MNLHKLFAMQVKLDKRISEEHGLQGQLLTDEKILALLVELGELANETRCFKFWSKKGPASGEVILEEFVDGVHFLLSIGIDLGVDSVLELCPKEKNVSVTKQFLNIFDLIAAFQNEQTEKKYVTLFENYLFLGQLLGFSSEQMERAYMLKNEVNHQRQDQGY